MSFSHVDSLKRLEVVCSQTNNSKEVRDVVDSITKGLTGTKTAEEIGDIRAALIHLCYMTENLNHQADVRRCCSILCNAFFGISLTNQLSCAYTCILNDNLHDTLALDT